MKLTFEKKLFGFFIFITSGLVTIGIISYHKNKIHSEHATLVTHTQEVLYETEQVISAAKDFESGSRGYIITGDSSFLIYFDVAKNKVEQHINKLKSLNENNPEQQSKIDSLAHLVQKRIEFSQKTIELRNTRGAEEAGILVKTKEGKNYMEAIRNLVDNIQLKENDLLKKRNSAYIESTNAFNLSFYYLLSSGITVLLLTFLIIRSNLLYRKKTEHELFIKNEWYNQTLISLGDGVITTDANGVITLINKAASELLGWTANEAIGSHIDMVFEITNERTGMKVINPLMEALQKNKVIWLANHTLLKKKDGSHLFIDDSGAPIHNSKGAVIGGVLIFRDITEKKMAEQKLIEANKKFTAIFNFSPVATAITSIDEGLFMYVNDAFCETTGYKRIDIIGKTSVDIQIIPANERERLIAELKKNGGHGKDIEIKIKKASGRIIDILYSAQPIDIDNKPCYLYAMVDISERKKIEREIKYLNESLERRVDERTHELSQSERQYKNLFENNPHPMWVYNLATLRFLNVNEAAMQHYGYTKSEFLSMSLKEIRPAEDIEHFLQQITYSPGLSHSGVWKHKKKNGEIILVEIVSHRLNYNGVDARLVLVNDVTERKKAEEELISKNLQLQKSNSELDKFVYSTSHDLRSPLTSLIGLIRITDENIKEEETEQKHRLAMMKRTVKRLDDFISEILDYSRNSRTAVAREEINFEDEIQKARENLKYMDGTQGYKLKVEINQSGKFISDKRRISIILNNLISNAIKYRDISKENPFVKITVHSAKTEASITIEDNGIGISEQDHQKIFEMFYRATMLSSGSGLGLYIVKETVDNLNGTIKMESQINLGSKFTITIPNLINDNV